MGSKRCNDCRYRKPLSEFNKNAARKDGLQSVCRPCQQARYRDYYHSDGGRERDRLRVKNSADIAAKRAMVSDLKRAPCTDCGVSYPPYVMDFDHLGEDKTGEIGANIHRWGVKRIRREIAKCELVCSNCHRIRTHERRQSPVV